MFLLFITEAEMPLSMLEIIDLNLGPKVKASDIIYEFVTCMESKAFSFKITCQNNTWYHIFNRSYITSY